MTTGQWLRVWERGEMHRLAAAACLAAGIAGGSPALANPAGGHVRDGAADIAQSGSTLTVTQHSDRAIIDWRSFSIANGELTRFVQPGAHSAVLNRVTGGNPSALLGDLRANGQVYLINPNGVLVGQGATIRTQGFVASTLDVSNQAFMAGGDLTFRGDSDAAVVNRGDIAALGGDVFLIARTVENAGVIRASEGVAGLAAGGEVLLKQAGDERLFVLADGGDAATGVEHAGVIEAAQAELKAAGGNVYALAINSDGVVRATGVERRGGRVLLKAGGGNVRVGGTLDASNTQGAGGTIHVLGERIELAGATLDASGKTGGGQVRVGGDFKGQGSLPTAQTTTVDADSALRADATQAGDGGSVVVWSDDTTAFHGTISARGAGTPGGISGTSGGAGVGGDAEVSGKEHLLVTGHADLRGPAGAGTLLLDPGSVSIIDGVNTAPGGAMDSFTDGWINDQLVTSNVTITTADSTNGGTEDLTVAADAEVSWSTGNSLTLEAGNDITVAGSIISTGAAAITLRADGSILLDSNAALSTQGGDVTLNSDRDDSGAGSITMASGSSIATGGGDALLFGGSATPGTVADPTDDASAFLTELLASGARGSGGHGISISDATINAGNGNIELRGVGDDGYDGVHVADGASLTTTNIGRIALYGVGGDGGNDNDGVNLVGDTTNLTAANGIITLYGIGRGADDGLGVVVDGEGGAATVSTGDGALLLSGVSQATGSGNQGVALVSGAVLRTTDDGDIVVLGEGSGAAHGHGVYLYDNSIVQTTGGGDITLLGYGSTTGTLTNNEGVKIQDQSLVEIQAGSNRTLQIIGIGGTGTSYNIGVNNLNSTVRMAAGVTGTLSVNGNGGAGSGTGNWGILAENNGVYESLGAADIVFSGGNGTGTDNAGIKVTSGSANRIGAATMTGDITLLTDNLDLEGVGVISVQSTGNLFIEPLSGAGSIGLGDGATGMLHINTTELGRLADGLASITIGGSAGTGDIDAQALSMSDPLTIRTPGGTLSVNGNLTTTGNLTLTAGDALNVLADINAGGAAALLVGQDGSGGTLTLDGDVIAAGGFTATGGSGDDTFNLNALVTHLTLNAGAGDDTVNTKLFANARQTLAGGAHNAGDTLNVDGQGATIDGDDSPITGDTIAKVTYSQFETVDVTNVTIDSSSTPSSGSYQVVNGTTGSYLVQNRPGGQSRNLTDEMQDATDAPAPTGQSQWLSQGAGGQLTGGLTPQPTFNYMQPGGQGQLRSDAQGQDRLAGASSFDLFNDAPEQGSDDDTAAQE